MKLLIFALTGFALAVPVAAQTPQAQDTLFQNYITADKDYIGIVDDKTRKIAAVTHPDCPITDAIQRYKPAILSKALFDFTIQTQGNNGKTDARNQSVVKNPYYGQWIEKTKTKTCGVTTQINILAIASNRGELPTLYPLLNGTTRIEPTFQAMAETETFNALQTRYKCETKTNNRTLTTKFAGYRQPNSQELSQENRHIGWLEQWAVHHCGKDYILNMAILPDTISKYKFVTQIKGEVAPTTSPVSD